MYGLKHNFDWWFNPFAEYNFCVFNYEHSSVSELRLSHIGSIVMFKESRNERKIGYYIETEEMDGSKFLTNIPQEYP